eukprot:Sdes_comp11768_c0_seq1m2840
MEPQEHIIYSSKSILNRQSPVIPASYPKAELTKDLELCSKYVKGILECLRRLKTEAFCQMEFSMFIRCKNQRNSELEKRIASWTENQLTEIKKSKTKNPKEFQHSLDSLKLSLSSMESIQAQTCGKESPEGITTRLGSLAPRYHYCNQVKYEIALIRDQMRFLNDEIDSLPVYLQ